MVFILEFMDNSQLGSTNWDKNTTKVLWSPGEKEFNKEEYQVYNIELKKQINHADSLSFTITYKHKFYDSFTSQNALGLTIGLRQLNGTRFYFYGRGVNVDNNGFGVKTITCEGALAFYNDIMLRPVIFATKEDPTNSKNWDGYLSYVTDKFSSRMVSVGCLRRNIGLGLHSSFIHVETSPDAIDIAETVRYSGIDDYKSVMEAINELISVDSRIMMWVESGIDNFGNVVNTLNVTTNNIDNPAATMALDKNIIDIAPSGNAFDMFSAIIPLDKNKLCKDISITTSKVDEHKTELNYNADDALFGKWGWTQIGYIEKVVNLDEYELNGDGDEDAEERGKMIRRAQAIVDQFGTRAVSEYSVKMVDLALLTNVEREPFTAHTSMDDIKTTYTILGRSSTALEQLRWNDEPGSIEMMWMYTGPYTITGKCTYIPVTGDVILCGFRLYQLQESVDQNTIYSWRKVEDAIYIPVTTYPVNLNPSNGIININFTPCTAQNGDKVVHEDYIYEWQYNVSTGTGLWVKIGLAINLDQRIHVNNEDLYVYSDANNFIDIAHRVHFKCPELGIEDDYYHPWVCTSLNMSIDNQGASSYTFSKIDDTYIPADNVMLSDWAEAVQGRAIKRRERPAKSASYLSEAQPISVVKVDDNHVIEFYPDREVHYEADGEGDVRNYIRSYNMPFGTTDPLNPFPDPDDND